MQDLTPLPSEDEILTPESENEGLEVILRRRSAKQRAAATARKPVKRRLGQSVATFLEMTAGMAITDSEAGDNDEDDVHNAQGEVMPVTVPSKRKLRNTPAFTSVSAPAQKKKQANVSRARAKPAMPSTSDKNRKYSGPAKTQVTSRPPRSSASPQEKYKVSKESEAGSDSEEQPKLPKGGKVKKQKGFGFEVRSILSMNATLLDDIFRPRNERSDAIPEVIVSATP